MPANTLSLNFTGSKSSATGFGLLLLDSVGTPIANATIRIVRYSDGFEEFNPNTAVTDAKGRIGFYLVKGEKHKMTITLPNGREYVYDIIAGYDNFYNIKLIVPVLSFICSYVVTKKESSLNFWGGSAKEMDKSVIKYQVL